MKLKNILNHFKKNYVFYVILLIVVYFVFSEMVWLNKDNRPSAWDDSWNLLASNYYYQRLVGNENRTPGEFGASFPSFRYAVRSYPPLFKISSLPLYLIFGFSKNAGVATNFLFYFILIFSVFLLTKKISGTNAALFSCFLVSTMPLLTGLARVYLLDFALSSAVILSLFLLFKTESFKNRKYSLVFAFSFGVGLMIKLQYFIFILPATVFFIGMNLGKWDKENTKNLILSVIVALPFLIFLFANSEGFLRYGLTAGSEKIALIDGDPMWNTFKGITYYFVHTINGISFFYFALFSLSTFAIIYFIVGDKITNKKIILTLYFSIFCSIFIFTFIPNKDHRFIAPIFPTIAALSSVGLWKLNLKKKLFLILLMFAVIYGLVQINGYTYEYRILGKNIYWNGIYISTNYNQYLVPARDEDWKIKEILIYIKDDSLKIEESKICINSDVISFNIFNFQMYAFAYGVNPKVIAPCSSDYRRFDYLIAKTGDLRGQSLFSVYEKIIKDENYYLLSEFELPDKTTAKIYKNENRNFSQLS